MTITRTDTKHYKAIADAINEKNKESKKYLPSEMAHAIKNMKASFPNGTEWTTVETNFNFYKIYYNNGIWYSIDLITKTLMYSKDGKIWNKTNLVISDVTDSSEFKIIYADDIWVCLINYKLYYSINGITWNAANIPLNNTYSFTHVSNMWIVNNNPTYTSLDGKHWKKAEFGNLKVMYEGYYANGLWVAYGDNQDDVRAIYISTDSKTWTPATVQPPIRGEIYYNNGIWIIYQDSGNLSDCGLCYSTDANNWVQVIKNKRVSDVLYANGLWVAEIESADSPFSMWSEDAQTWHDSNIIDYSIKSSLLYVCHSWVVISNFQIYHSIDGKNWKKVESISSGAAQHIAWGNGLWIVTTVKFGSDTTPLLQSITWEP